MNALTAWDHLFSVIVFIAYPLVAWRTFPRVVERIRARGESARLAEYWMTIAIWLGFTGALVLMWILLGRDWNDLGLRPGEPWRLGVGAVLALGLLWLTNDQMNKLAAASREHEGVAAEQLGDLVEIVPTNRRELIWFRAVGVNAAITEELIFRGYLLWYLEPVVGIWPAALVAIVAFTLGHAYQGLSNLPGIAFASLSFVGLYLLTDSLLVPVLLHAGLDILQGNAFARIAARAREVESR